jgi:3-hydroxyisobutyrate dehydrogenase
MLGGAPEAVATCRPILDRLGANCVVVGSRAGDGQAMKAVNQLLCGIHIVAVAEAISLARGLGLDPTNALNVLGQGAASSFMLADRGPRMVAALEGQPEVRSRLDIFVKDLNIVTTLAKSRGLPTPVASASEQIFLLATQAGLGAADDSTLISLITR